MNNYRIYISLFNSVFLSSLSFSLFSSSLSLFAVLHQLLYVSCVFCYLKLLVFFLFIFYFYYCYYLGKTPQLSVTLYFFHCQCQTCRKYEFAAVDQPIEAFTNILFSSGTTGNLKLLIEPFPKIDFLTNKM